MTPEQIATATSMIVAGATQREAAAAIGLHPTNLCRNLANKDELRAMIREAQVKLIAGSLDKAVQNQQDKIEISGQMLKRVAKGDDLPKGAKTLLELGDRAEDRLLQSVGIAPAHTQSIQFQQLVIAGGSELSPTVERLLASHIAGDVIEAQVEDASGPGA